MLSKYISPGTKIELQRSGKSGGGGLGPDKKIYYSKVHNILDSDRMEITMPMEKTRLMLLDVDEEYDTVFYTEKGLYQGYIRILDRYKSNNIIMLLVELTSNLRKFQRREYYRFSCVLEMHTRNLSEEESEKAENNQPVVLNSELPMDRSIIVDISGGGLRFITDCTYEVGSLVSCNYQCYLDGELKDFHLIGRILRVNESVNRHGIYEHRLQFLNIKLEEREDIIKYIFQEERKSRKKENGF